MWPIQPFIHSESLVAVGLQGLKFSFPKYKISCWQIYKYHGIINYRIQTEACE
jgi:hypothetical protein